MHRPFFEGGGWGEGGGNYDRIQLDLTTTWCQLLDEWKMFQVPLLSVTNVITANGIKILYVASLNDFKVREDAFGVE